MMHNYKLDFSKLEHENHSSKLPNIQHNKNAFDELSSSTTEIVSEEQDVERLYLPPSTTNAGFHGTNDLKKSQIVSDANNLPQFHEMMSELSAPIYDAKPARSRRSQSTLSRGKSDSEIGVRHSQSKTNTVFIPVKSRSKSRRREKSAGGNPKRNEWGLRMDKEAVLEENMSLKRELRVNAQEHMVLKTKNRRLEKQLKKSDKNLKKLLNTVTDNPEIMPVPPLFDENADPNDSVSIDKRPVSRSSVNSLATSVKLAKLNRTVQNKERSKMSIAEVLEMLKSEQRANMALKRKLNSLHMDLEKKESEMKNIKGTMRFSNVLSLKSQMVLYQDEVLRCHKLLSKRRPDRPERQDTKKSLSTYKDVESSDKLSNESSFRTGSDDVSSSFFDSRTYIPIDEHQLVVNELNAITEKWQMLQGREDDMDDRLEYVSHQLQIADEQAREHSIEMSEMKERYENLENEYRKISRRLKQQREQWDHLEMCGIFCHNFDAFVDMLMESVQANKAKIFARKIEVWWEQMKFPEASVRNCVQHAVSFLEKEFRAPSVFHMKSHKITQTTSADDLLESARESVGRFDDSITQLKLAKRQRLEEEQRQRQARAAQENEAAIRIQKQWKGHKCRKSNVLQSKRREKEKKKQQKREEERAATKIQASWRGKQTRSRGELIARKRTRERERKRMEAEINSAAAKIQSQYRGYRVRRRDVLDENELETYLDGDERSEVKDKVFREMREQEKNIRRAETAEAKARDEASRRVQAAWRGHSCRSSKVLEKKRKERQQREQQRKEAASTIQKYWRAILARRYTQRLLQEHLLREEIKKEKQREEEDVLLLQSIFRNQHGQQDRERSYQQKLEQDIELLQSIIRTKNRQSVLPATQVEETQESVKEEQRPEETQTDKPQAEEPSEVPQQAVVEENVENVEADVALIQSIIRAKQREAAARETEEDVRLIQSIIRARRELPTENQPKADESDILLIQSAMRAKQSRQNSQHDDDHRLVQSVLPAKQPPNSSQDEATLNDDVRLIQSIISAKQLRNAPVEEEGHEVDVGDVRLIQSIIRAKRAGENIERTEEDVKLIQSIVRQKSVQQDLGKRQTEDDIRLIQSILRAKQAAREEREEEDVRLIQSVLRANLQAQSVVNRTESDYDGDCDDS